MINNKNLFFKFEMNAEIGGVRVYAMQRLQFLNDVIHLLDGVNSKAEYIAATLAINIK